MRVVGVLRARGRIASSISALLVATGLALCGTGCAREQRRVTVVLTEWHVEPKPATTKAGNVHFVVENAGFVSHELVIVRGDDPESLPTDASGAVDEARIAKQDRVGRVGIVAPRETKKTMLNLTPGEYILFCNVVDKQSSSARQGFSHFAERMVDTLTVTK